MLKELKFPVMYAVLELKEEGGYSYNYEDVTRGFIVSKCHVLREITNYQKDGTSSTSYLVSFPYNNIRDFRYELEFDGDCAHIGEPKVPHKDATDDWSKSDTTMVWELFTSYEGAKEVANLRNKELQRNARLYGSIKSILSSSTEKQCANRLSELEASLKVCEVYESLIQAKTADMEITGIPPKTNQVRIREK